MNICVVSSFEGEVEEFMSMVSEFDDELKSAVSDFDIGVVSTDKVGSSKIITMANVTDMERFEEIVSTNSKKEFQRNWTEVEQIARYQLPKAYRKRVSEIREKFGLK